MDAATIAQIRRFNRSDAEGIRTLPDHFLGRGLPDAQPRWRWEIRTDGAVLRAPRGRPAPGSVKTPRGEPAYLKRMWVAREARGLGVGRRLLTELEEYARSTGARVIQLETNRALTEAIALYRASGYVEVPAFNAEPYAHHWFE